jgi:hypothetical protein
MDAEIAGRLGALLADLPAADREARLLALKLETKLRRAVAAALSAGLPAAEPAPSDLAVRRALRAAGSDALFLRLAIARADLVARALDPAPADRLRDAAARQIEAGVPLGVRDLAVRGDAIAEALGVRPGPVVGRVLQALLDHVLERPSDNTPEALLALAARVAAGLDGPDRTAR